MQESKCTITAEAFADVYEADNKAELVQKMDDDLAKHPNRKLLSRSFHKTKKAARKAQKKARRRNRK